jgi:hypothetical protein
MNSCSEEQLSELHPIDGWRREIDPCRRNMVRFELSSREEYERAWSRVQIDQQTRLASEAEEHATSLSKAFSFDRVGRFKCFEAAMEYYGREMGFSLSRSRSKQHYPLIAKSLTDEWDICWAIEEPKKFCLGPTEGRFTPHLEIRHRNLEGSVELAESGEFLLIRYHHLLPGFGAGYWKFSELTELETLVKAHLCLYKCMAPVIEEGIRSTLSTV